MCTFVKYWAWQWVLGLKRVKLDQENIRNFAFVLIFNLFWEIVYVIVFFFANSLPDHYLLNVVADYFANYSCGSFYKTLCCRPFSWKFCKLQFHVTTLQIAFLCFCKNLKPGVSYTLFVNCCRRQTFCKLPFLMIWFQILPNVAPGDFFLANCHSK